MFVILNDERQINTIYLTFEYHALFQLDGVTHAMQIVSIDTGHELYVVNDTLSRVYYTIIDHIQIRFQSDGKLDLSFSIRLFQSLGHNFLD